MTRDIRKTLLVLLLATGSCIGSTAEPGMGTSTAEPGMGTESGNPRFFETCLCETDSDCMDAFDWQIGMYDASVRALECVVETGQCRAVLEVDGSCYVNLAVDSRAYQCTLTDPEIFEQSESDPDRPSDASLSKESCE